MTQTLIPSIEKFVASATPELIERVILALERSANWESVSILPHIPSPILTTLIADIVRGGRISKRPPSDVAFAIATACAVELRSRRRPRIELVLSGPSFPPYEMRRTDETILELIQAAQERLTIVSFVVYRVERLANALSDAVMRGVEIRLFLETETLSDREKRLLSADAALQDIQVYSWLVDQRLRSPQGKHGVLHAKATIADSSILFISSANITEHAMSLNIELGTLIRDGVYAQKVEQLFDKYITNGVFKRLHI